MLPFSLVLSFPSTAFGATIPALSPPGQGCLVATDQSQSPNSSAHFFIVLNLELRFILFIGLISPHASAPLANGL